MCLRVLGGFTTRTKARDFTKTPLVSDNDITVYKVLSCVDELTRMRYISPYRYISYRRGEVKEAKAFSFKVTGIKGYWRININKGIHSYQTLASALIVARAHIKNGIVIKCVIPKGTPYFEGFNVYVSLKLKTPNEYKDYNNGSISKKPINNNLFF